METIEQYLGRPDTPAAGSPVGQVMVKVLDKFPGIGFEDARVKAQELLNHAAKAKNYRLPRVRSAKEKAADAKRLKKAFVRVKEAA